MMGGLTEDSIFFLFATHTIHLGIQFPQDYAYTCTHTFVSGLVSYLVGSISDNYSQFFFRACMRK